MSDKKDQHKYQKDKGGGFKIDTTDPIQDVMNDEELKEAERRIKSLIEGDTGNDTETKKS